jgi:biopolymer transport protein ExbB
MSITSTRTGRAFAWAALVGLVFWMMAGPTGFGVWRAMAQDTTATKTSEASPKAGDAAPSRVLSPEEVAKKAEEDLAKQEKVKSEGVAAAAPEEAKMNILELLMKGGPLMWPILVMSLVAVAFGMERILGLRRRKVLPPELIHALGSLAGQPGGLDPRKAYKLCQEFPSAAANVIRAMLLKVGRPHTELEHTVTEAEEREAAKLYTNIRWLTLAAGISPLLGLLGTVWGMILAFFATANLAAGVDKTRALADGIYQALVTTLAGLTVAIPAAVLAHFLEGRIQSLFRELDETLLGLMPQLERFEGRLRASHDPGNPLALDPAASNRPARPAAPAEQKQPRPDPAPQ